MTVELRHFRFLALVAEKLGIRRAAEAAGLKASTISHHIRTLEEELGVGLFVRRRNGIELTPAGREFLAHVYRVLQEFDQAVGLAGRLGRAETGELAVGIFTSLASGRLRDLLQRFREGFPDVDVRFVESNRVDLLARVRERRLDVALVMGRLDGDSGIEARALWDERLLAALPAEHPLVEAPTIRWSDLARDRMLVRTWEKDGEMLHFLVAKLAVDGRAPYLLKHQVGRESLLNLVSTGYGVTVVAESAAAVPYPSVVFRPIAEDDASIKVSAAWLAENGNPAARRFLSLCRARSA